MEIFADVIEIAAMRSPSSPATLQVYLTYYAQANGNITELDLTMFNYGDTSATLEYIQISEEGRPSTTSCTINTTCYFKPQSQVYIEPGQVNSITICQNCMANNTSVYSHPFNNNAHNLIEVKAVISMLINWGYQTRLTNVPFMYTIPRR